MTQNEKDYYYEEFMKLDIKTEISKALRMDSVEGDDNYYVEICEIFDRLNFDLDSDIKEARKNIIISYSVIDGLKDKLINTIKLQEDEKDEETKKKFDNIIFNTIQGIDDMYKQVQDIVSDINIIKHTKRYVDNLVQKGILSK